MENTPREANADNPQLSGGAAARIAQGLRELKEGLGVDRPEWTRIPESSLGEGQVVDDQKDDK